MNWDKKEFKKLPQYLSLETYRKFCHISKKTANYYLKTGLLKNSCTVSTQSRYKIKKSDLKEFLDEFEANPERFKVAKNWYSTIGLVLTSQNRRISNPDTKIQEVYNYTVKNYYEKCLKNYPDLLKTKDVSQITGYNRHTVKGWQEKGKLKCLTANPRLLIPKVYMQEFLTSDFFDKINKKSDLHKHHIEVIEKQTDHNLTGR